MIIIPYKRIPLGANVLIHGFGKIGREVVSQLAANEYCNIMAVVDKKANEIADCPFPIFCFEDSIPFVFDRIIIAIDDAGVIDEVKDDWIGKGISEEAILSVKIERLNLSDNPFMVKGTCKDYLTIAIRCTAGLGDSIIDYILACKIKNTLGSMVRVVMETRYKELYDDLPIIDEVVCQLNGRYDLVIRSMMIPIIEQWAPNRIRERSDILYEYCNNCISDYKALNNSIDYLKFLSFGKLLGKKRVDMIDIHSVFGFNYDKEVMRPVHDDDSILERYGLQEDKFIVINRDVDQVQMMSHPKLWPIEYYNSLVKMIRIEHPEFHFVQVGACRDNNNISSVDIDLSGKTSLKEIRSLLAHARFLISGEGGLVHLNHFVGGKSVVLYGPTDELFFKYDEDIVCVKRDEWCSMPCNYIINDYVKGCIKGAIPAGCMSALTPEYVYSRMVEEGTL